MVELIYQTELWSWWLLVPATLLTILIFCALFWHWSKLSIFSGLSLAFFVLILLVQSVSWKANHSAGCLWYTLQPSGDHHKYDLTLINECGGIRLGLHVIHLNPHSADKYDPRIRVGISKVVAAENVTFAYPLLNRSVSVFQSDFLDKLGFQLCWWSIPDKPGINGPVGWYSITVPGWFALLVCLIFPAFSLKRVLRRRARIRRGLCGKCGYDLRPSKSEKCPECGMPIPPRKEIAKAPDTAKPAA